MDTLTVEELHARLDDLIDQGKGNLEIRCPYNYGDHWRTEVAMAPSDVYIGYVEYSAYHRMDKVIEEGEEKDDSEEVVILGMY